MAFSTLTLGLLNTVPVKLPATSLVLEEMVLFKVGNLLPQGRLGDAVVVGHLGNVDVGILAPLDSAEVVVEGLNFVLCKAGVLHHLWNSVKVVCHRTALDHFVNGVFSLGDKVALCAVVGEIALGIPKDAASCAHERVIGIGTLNDVPCRKPRRAHATIIEQILGSAVDVVVRRSEGLESRQSSYTILVELVGELDELVVVEGAVASVALFALANVQFVDVDFLFVRVPRIYGCLVCEPDEDAFVGSAYATSNDIDGEKEEKET